MFEISGTRIRITQGDTGLLTFVADSSGYVPDADDRALFTVRRSSGGVVMEKVIKPYADGRVQVPLLNEETKEMAVGLYAWDIRYTLGAVLDASGRITGGREVITPIRPGVLEILKGVGQI